MLVLQSIVDQCHAIVDKRQENVKPLVYRQNIFDKRRKEAVSPRNVYRTAV